MQPRAYVAYYPGCTESYKKWNYEVHSPLLIMIGELDDWTPAASCVNLRNRLKSDKANAPVELLVYPGSYHGFDGTGPVIVRDGVANTKSGKATVGGNPEARRASHEQLFEFLSTQLKQPLLLTHAQRFQDR